MIRATVPDQSVLNGKNLHGDKPITMAIVIVCRQTGHEPIRAVVWHSQSKGSNYATVWAHGRLPGAFATIAAGHGRASGYGYHRPSAALQAAFDSAEIKLSEPIDGRGEHAMIEACKAVAVALGYAESDLVAVTV